MADSTNEAVIVKHSGYETTLIVVAIAAIILGVLGLFLVYYIRTLKSQKKESVNKKCIYPYLQNFEVDDIDIRRAPTGGWHGTYINKLAYGINEFETKSETSRDNSSSKDTLLFPYDDEVEDAVDIEIGRQDFEKARKDSRFMGGAAAKAASYYGLSVVDDSNDKTVYDDVRPWRKTEDTI
jgi:type II secretory pathway pseudopilin PulG